MIPRTTAVLPAGDGEGAGGGTALVDCLIKLPSSPRIVYNKGRQNWSDAQGDGSGCLGPEADFEDTKVPRLVISRRGGPME